jgi:hypothetical protein
VDEQCGQADGVTRRHTDARTDIADGWTGGRADEWFKADGRGRSCSIVQMFNASRDVGQNRDLWME